MGGKIGEVLFGFDVELTIHPTSLPRSSEHFTNPTILDLKHLPRKLFPTRNV
jgi:hypothetical protein